MSTEKIFIKPKLEGQRFDDHTLPVNILEDFSAFEELIFELAKKIYLDLNPQRKRVPKGFTENIYLKLSTIEEGSTIPQIVIATTISVFATPSISVPNDEYFSYFEKARDKVFELIENANSDRSVETESKFLNYFNRIGKNLKEGETIDFLNSDSSTRNVTFSKNTRRKILLSRNEKLEYSELIHENVRISAIDKKKQVFYIELKDATYECPIVTDFHDTIITAFQEYENKTLISVKATGLFNNQNKLIHIEKIESMDILDPFDVSVRLNDLLELKDKWYDGVDGKMLNQKNTLLFKDYFNAYFNSDLQLPAIFPTLNGNIVLEWKKGVIEIAIEIDLSNLNAEIFYFDMENDDNDFQENIELKNVSDWIKINTLISQNIT